ncbi:hypothetical protein [Kamptonema formosum]|uniref:hypothetical protein n=1 Tax=Kamptonema formosum TaxID=331992 RepID=UPI00034D7818|nr:hypothetical protein [Oscillatoria sp. PCC 10802]
MSRPLQVYKIDGIENIITKNTGKQDAGTKRKLDVRKNSCQTSQIGKLPFCHQKNGGRAMGCQHSRHAVI